MIAGEHEGRIVKVGWVDAGMALKLAYGDEVGFDLWGETHEDDQARADAPGQWASFASEARPGYVTIGTLIKAAKRSGLHACDCKEPIALGRFDSRSARQLCVLRPLHDGR